MLYNYTEWCTIHLAQKIQHNINKIKLYNTAEKQTLSNAFKLTNAFNFKTDFL